MGAALRVYRHTVIRHHVEKHAEPTADCARRSSEKEIYTLFEFNVKGHFLVIAYISV